MRAVRLAVTELTTLVDMRRFIVTNPNLSVGRPGDIVTSDQLKMSDDKLDEWVAASFGIEIDEAPLRFDEPADVKTAGATTTVTTVALDDDED